MMFSDTFYYLSNINIISQFLFLINTTTFTYIASSETLACGWGGDGTGVCGPWKVIISWKRGEYRGFKVCQLYVNVKNKFD